MICGLVWCLLREEERSITFLYIHIIFFSLCFGSLSLPPSFRTMLFQRWIQFNQEEKCFFFLNRLKGYNNPPYFIYFLYMLLFLELLFYCSRKLAWIFFCYWMAFFIEPRNTGDYAISYLFHALNFFKIFSKHFFCHTQVGFRIFPSLHISIFFSNLEL